MPDHEERPEPPLPWLRLLGWFLLSRVVIVFTAWATLRTVPKGRFFEAPASALHWLMRWDAPWFRDVIQNGYAFHPDRMSNVNFLPAYPLLVRSLSWAMPVEVAGYLVSAILCFAAGLLLWRLTERIDGRPLAADGAVLFLFFGPVAVFFTTLYSESAFLAFALLSIYAAYRDRWLVAGLAGFAAALSRSIGVFLVIPLLVLFLQRHATPATWRQRRTWLAFAACGLPAVASIAFTTYLGWRFGEPRAYLISQKFGGHDAEYFWRLFTSRGFREMGPFYQTWFAGAIFVGFALTALGTLIRLPIGLTLFSFAVCLLYSSMRSLEGMPRFMSIIFPFYITLGHVWARWPRAGGFLLGVSCLLLLLSVTLFVNGYWFT